MDFLRKKNSMRSIISISTLIVSTIFCFLISFRSSGGADYGNYLIIFQSIEEDFSSYALFIEPLQLITMYFFKWTSLGFGLYNFALSFCILYFNYRICKYYKLSYFFSSFVFFSVFFVPYIMNGLPQGFAMALSYFIVLKYPSFIGRIVVVILVTFHKSAIFALLYPQNYRFKLFCLSIFVFIIFLFFLPRDLLPKYNFVGNIDLSDYIYRIYIFCVFLFVRIFAKGSSSTYDAGLFWLFASILVLLSLHDQPIVALRINMFMRYIEVFLISLSLRLSKNGLKILVMVALVPLYTAIGINNFLHPTAQINF
jgi:hypothetical protein